MGKRLLYVIVMCGLLLSCKDEEPDLPSVEERVSQAIEDLQDELTRPADGWKILYQPTPTSGAFLLVLDFHEDGTVTISSDLAANDGEFFEQTIPYRIDAGLGLELVFETYGFFHYLFELDQASFGAEFQFVYVEEEEGNLYFVSKSDLFDVSAIVLEPATAADRSAFSREIASNFDEFAGQSARIFGGTDPSQQLYLEEAGYSIFWTIDLVKRTVYFDIAGPGATVEEVLAGDFTSLGQSSGYSFADGKMIFSNPIQVNIGQNITLSELTLGSFSETGAPLCAGSPNTPVYTVTVDGAGAGTLSKTLFNSSGLGFEPQENNFYSVNIPFIFDADLRSLAEEGSIFEKLPNAIGFMMTYGFESDSIPENGVGFIVEDSLGAAHIYLRTFVPVALGNRLQLTLQDQYYYSTPPSAEEELAMAEITDEIFEGGTVYAFDLPIQGLEIYQFYNPCNSYEFLLVK